MLHFLSTFNDSPSTWLCGDCGSFNISLQVVSLCFEAEFKIALARGGRGGGVSFLKTLVENRLTLVSFY
jgi:hypothetical protein